MKRLPRSNLITARLATLSDPIRLRLLRLLEREELSVGELSKVVQLPQSTVSRHLRLIADGGWVSPRSEGTSTIYRLLLDDLPMDLRALWVTVRDQLGSAEQSPELAEDARRLAGVLTDRRTDTRGFFGRFAGEWDQIRDELFGRRMTFQALLPLVPHEWTIADLGCGTGNAAELLAPVVSRVIAVDQNEAMLDAARKRLSGHANIDFRRGDLESLPLASAEVDAAVCVLVLHHVPQPEAACREMARVVRPGGVVLIVDMVEHDREWFRRSMGHRWQGFGLPEVIRVLTGAGLERPRLLTLPSDTEAKGPGLFACTARRPLNPPAP
ncbi:MAG: ArsR family transcriptional regulator [Isosphaera sp.]|nr:ArsR family transcriptional regulator [Isosphaera sp.]